LLLGICIDRVRGEVRARTADLSLLELFQIFGRIDIHFPALEFNGIHRAWRASITERAPLSPLSAQFKRGTRKHHGTPAYAEAATPPSLALQTP
jgi:hypothetical protein